MKIRSTCIFQKSIASETACCQERHQSRNVKRDYHEETDLKFESHPTIGTKKKLKEQIAKSSDCRERFQLTQPSE